MTETIYRYYEIFHETNIWIFKFFMFRDLKHYCLVTIHTNTNKIQEVIAMNNSTKIPNRLINEKSPYLLQHAHNPVDWFAWGEEAFTKAKAENRPVFLSVGYS